MIKIRLAEETDLDSILKVIEIAFSDEENKVIMNLVQELSRETTSPSIKSLVAEVDNEVIGYVQFLLKSLPPKAEEFHNFFIKSVRLRVRPIIIKWFYRFSNITTHRLFVKYVS